MTAAPQPPPAPLPVLDLGLAPYEETRLLQADLRSAVADGSLAGALLLLEHPPVITLGSRGTDADLRSLPDPSSRAGGELPILRSERGGAATLHAPGQLVSYPVIPVPGRDLRRFVWGLEEVLVRLLADLGVHAERRAGHPGLYVDTRKIASVGLRCQRWVSSHGTSLNVSLDLALFERIVSCGEEDLRQTSVQELTGAAPGMAAVKLGYAVRFAEVFGRDLLPVRRAALPEARRSLLVDIAQGSAL